MATRDERKIPYEELEHTADWKIRVWGKDYADLFRNAALAMYALMGQTEQAGPEVQRHIEVEGTDYPSLLVAWLNELLFYTEVNGEVFRDVEIVHLTPERLEANVRGFVGDVEVSKIKAATYHELDIRETPEGVEATIVFDV